MWTDYLDFFDGVVKEKGIEETLVEYAFHPEIMPRLVSSSLHSLLHIGLGMEFKEPMIVAEGIAQAIVHSNRSGYVIDTNFWEYSTEYTPIAEILRQIEYDERLDDVLLYSDDYKLTSILLRKPDIIREYVKKFGINEKTLLSRYEELYRSIIIVYATCAQRPDLTGVRLDFNL
jgi:hypothetical protein